MRKFILISLYSVAVLLFISCKKTEGFNSLTDNQPSVAVNVSNAFDYLPAPTVLSSKAQNKITITLQLPDNTGGRTIKEINKIAASTTANYSAIFNGTVVGTSTSQLWSNTVIPVNATSYTFNTTIDEYKTKTGTTATPASNAFLGRDFYFLLTLDDGSQIIPRNTRVWVVD